jgi:intracellular sulfur oxidation DsrE/DsrF family protein
MQLRSHLPVLFAVASILLIAGPGQAQDASDEKPFAEAHVVLQLSDQEREAVVLDVANNLIKHYGGPDFIDIEIVTFGPGVRLLFADSGHEDRISSLVDNGVRFYICENTLDTIEREQGTRPKVSAHALSVQTGVAHIIERVNEGHTLVRP